MVLLGLVGSRAHLHIYLEAKSRCETAISYVALLCYSSLGHGLLNYQVITTQHSAIKEKFGETNVKKLFVLKMVK